MDACKLLVAVATGAAFAALAVAHVDGNAADSAKRCKPGTKTAVVDGRRRCLRSGMGCNSSDDRQYHRYGFHCHLGVLYVDIWEHLRRPLHVPRLPPGSPCPLSAPEQRVDFAAYGVGRGFGEGPAYPIFGGPDPPGEAVLRFRYPPPPASEFAGSAWGGQKVLWFILPEAAGPILVRGRQLDGSHEVRFELGTVPPRELYFGPRVRRDRPSYTRLQAPGCYAYQIDGLTFSRLIVFEARLG